LFWGKLFPFRLLLRLKRLHPIRGILYRTLLQVILK
jgi:hypothetical protein